MFGPLLIPLLLTLNLTPAAQEAPEATMKAVRIHAFGGVEELKYEDAPRPVPRKGEVLIRVQAAGVNPVDWKAREGLLKDLNPKLPQILGFDIAGTVEELGPEAKRFQRGDVVFGYLPLAKGGGYAQYVTVAERHLALAPKKATAEQAAAMPVAALTAWQALVVTAKLESGQKVLIQGGSGGVGHFAVQIAKLRGAYVYATASTRNQEFLKELGADRPIDYTRENFEDIAKDVDVVLDTVGGEVATRSYSTLKNGGIFISLVGDPDTAALEKRGARGQAILVQPNAKQLTDLSALVDEGKLRVVVSEVIPLAEARRAHELSATGRVRGKLVLSVAH
jgi:NADPH:quinone reductase-like Zn-dependent oxidoreductase